MDIVSSIVFISCPSFKDMFREFGFAFCISEVFPMFFKSCVEVSVGSSYIKFVYRNIRNIRINGTRPGSVAAGYFRLAVQDTTLVRSLVGRNFWLTYSG